MQKDPAAILDIKEDIREECAKLGEVTNVVLYDKEPDGVASVRFSNSEAANACVRVSLISFRPVMMMEIVYPCTQVALTDPSPSRIPPRHKSDVNSPVTGHERPLL